MTDRPGLSTALCNFISSHFSIKFLILSLSLSALLEEDILICERDKIAEYCSPTAEHCGEPQELWLNLTSSYNESRQDNISTVFSPQDLPHPGISSQVINCRNDRDMLSIALLILIINIVMSQSRLRDCHQLPVMVSTSPQFRISKQCYKVMTINLHHMLTNALDANIPGLAEFWIIISHYCIEVLFSLEDFPHVEVFKLIPNVPLRRPFIIVTGYSQNEPWKIFAFNFVPPNLVCLKKNFYAVLSDTSYSQSVSPATKDEIMRTYQLPVLTGENFSNQNIYLCWVSATF